MYCLSIALGNTVWALMFNDEEAASKAWAMATPYQPDQNACYVIEITDDYGQTIRVNKNDSKGFMFEDLDKTKLAYIERAIHQQRTQMEAQKRWQADPAARAFNAGPAVLTPGMNGPGFRQ